MYICIYIYVCIYVYVYICIYVYVYICIYVSNFTSFGVGGFLWFRNFCPYSPVPLSQLNASISAKCHIKNCWTRNDSERAWTAPWVIVE